MEFLKWLVRSSADPRNFSLAIKGIVTLCGAWLLHASMLACGLGIYCLGVSDQSVNEAITIITNLAYALALFVGAVMALFGFLRKLYLARWSAYTSI